MLIFSRQLVFEQESNMIKMCFKEDITGNT